jgi:hypothetical protein
MIEVAGQLAVRVGAAGEAQRRFVLGSEADKRVGELCSDRPPVGRSCSSRR